MGWGYPMADSRSKAAIETAEACYMGAMRQVLAEHDTKGSKELWATLLDIEQSFHKLSRLLHASS